MKNPIAFYITALISVLLLMSSPAYSQTSQKTPPLTGKDYVESHPELFRILVDNNRVRVLEYTLEPGEKEDWHSHPDMVLYVIEGGDIEAEFEDGKVMVFEEIVGTAKYMDAGAKHTAKNISKKRIQLLITEFK